MWICSPIGSESKNKCKEDISEPPATPKEIADGFKQVFFFPCLLLIK